MKIMYNWNNCKPTLDKGKMKINLDKELGGERQTSHGRRSTDKIAS